MSTILGMRGTSQFQAKRTDVYRVVNWQGAFAVRIDNPELHKCLNKDCGCLFPAVPMPGTVLPDSGPTCPTCRSGEYIPWKLLPKHVRMRGFTKLTDPRNFVEAIERAFLYGRSDDKEAA